RWIQTVRTTPARAGTGERSTYSIDQSSHFSAPFGVNPVICRGSIGDRAVEFAAHSRHWLIRSGPLRGWSSSITPMSAGTGPHGGRTTHGFLPAPPAMDVSAAAAPCEFGPPRRDRANSLPGRGVRMVGLDAERIEATRPAALAVVRRGWTTAGPVPRVGAAGRDRASLAAAPLRAGECCHLATRCGVVAVACRTADACRDELARVDRELLLLRRLQHRERGAPPDQARLSARHLPRRPGRG